MAFLEISNGPQAGQKTQIAQETFFIGRDPNNHLSLLDRTISRKHAVINLVENQYIISDLKSLKGILVNGSKMNEAVLQDGDEITLGALRLHFYLNDTGNAFAATEPKQKKWFVAGGVLVSFLLAGTGFYFFKGRTPSKQLLNPDAIQIEQHYQRGVELFNIQKDMAGAKEEWQMAIDLDTDKTTVYGQKAAKLLETVGSP